ncbi:MAG: STAS domain-containing protein [Desulfuromonadales bacterium]
MPLNSSVRENGEIIITSGDRLTIENAADFARLTREALEASHLVAVEFEPGVELDITGVQILCSACKCAANSGKIFTYHGRQPQALADIISTCGAERHAVCKHNNDSTCIWFGGAS